MRLRSIALWLEIALLLPFVALAVRLVSIRRIKALAQPTPNSALSPDQLALAQLAGKWAARLYLSPLTRNECLARCLTAKIVLARRGIGTTILFGIRRLGSADRYEVPDYRRDYRAHAWLDAADGTGIILPGRAAWKTVGKIE